MATNNEYWEARKDLLYYQVVRILTQSISRGAGSLIDVGSAGCPYLDWCEHVAFRTSIDLRSPYVAPGIQSHVADFLEWTPDRRYDVATCLQVLEHVPEAGLFAQKLLAVAPIVVVSVPYKWKKGQTKSHVHDPVDERKLYRWFGRKPHFSHVVGEIQSRVRRLVCVYESCGKPWRSLNERESRVQRAS